MVGGPRKVESREDHLRKGQGFINQGITAPVMNEGDRPVASLSLRPPRAPHVVSGQSPDTAPYVGQDVPGDGWFSKECKVRAA